MEKLTPQNPETQSADIITGNIAQLKALFPELITESADGTTVNIDILKQLIGDKTVTDVEEKYGLNWHGKRRARQLALTPSTGTLRPCPEDSVDWDTTQNLMIEGDNLEVLKLLQKSYAGKVKLIYIDPPYNTGKDFVYPDNFQDNIKNYLELTGQIEGGQKISSNTEASGRFHTDWLNMIYPRLTLARNLLRSDGVIAVHIDENEYPNLEKLLNEILGEENNLGTVVWDKRNPKGEVVGVGQQHELISIYCKNKDAFAANANLSRKKENAEAMLNKAASLIKTAGTVNDEVKAFYKKWLKERKNELSGGELAYSEIDENGDVYRPVSMAAPDKPETRSHRPLIHPTTGKNCPVPAKGWRYPDKTMDDLLSRGKILFGVDETTQPTQKYLLRENIRENFPSLLYFGGSGDALDIPFENPKPLKVGALVVDAASSEADIVLDFFAGSGTTGHAVMAQNAVDGGKRRYILVQLPEPLDPENKDQKVAADYCDSLHKPRNIAELTKERLRRAAAKIEAENSSWHGDTGFRVFKLDSTNIRAWEPDRDNLATSLFDATEHLKSDRTEQDILFELLLKLGLDLTVPMETKVIAGKTVYSIGAGVLMVCLADTIASADVEVLSTGIVAWHAELAPVGDTQLVFRDSAFSDDAAKANCTAILQQHGLINVRSL
ncbi:site-specific DNA-methyltransferase [Methylovorus mays]|uniref:site-specific DNA-methyltransferase n=1 Tax=Methylovorus mays TaxID=184077 RepID=UPI001E283A8C|nr:site-specific DNA-methyltransferase [Methylovorus mays]MCB5207717.1 site-specific DNA-methyltransferase [Methylovorus mays]